MLEEINHCREEHEFLGETSRFDSQHAPFFYSKFKSNCKNIILGFCFFLGSKTQISQDYLDSFSHKCQVCVMVSRLLSIELTVNKTSLTSWFHQNQSLLWSYKWDKKNCIAEINKLSTLHELKFSEVAEKFDVCNNNGL